MNPQLRSPLHVDIRPVWGWPGHRHRLLDLAVETLTRDVFSGDRDQDGRPDGPPDALACRTDGQAVPLATLLAERLNRPLLFVRRDGVTDCHKHRVEGRLEQGWRILLVEPLAADGRRKADLAQALLDAGGQVTDLFVVFHYGIYDALHAHLSPLGVRLHTLCTWWDLLEVASDGHRLPEDDLAAVRATLGAPPGWPSVRHR